MGEPKKLDTAKINVMASNFDLHILHEGFTAYDAKIEIWGEI